MSEAEKRKRLNYKKRRKREKKYKNFTHKKAPF